MKEEVDMYSIKTVPVCLPDPGRDKFLIQEKRAADVTGFGLIVNPRDGRRKHPDVVQTASGDDTYKTTLRLNHHKWKLNQMLSLFESDYKQ